MIAGELLNHLRMKLTSLGLPLPFDQLLLTYIDNAYKGFVNGMGGVADEYDLTVPANTMEVTLPTYVLKIKSAERADGKFVDVINRADTRQEVTAKYGSGQQGIRFGVPGEIRFLMIGTKPNVAKVASTPTVDTQLIIDIDRLPVAPLAALTDVVTDVGDVWQLNILDGAVASVMRNNPDPNVRAQAGAYDTMMAEAYGKARKEKQRAKSKLTRVVRYGGI